MKHVLIKYKDTPLREAAAIVGHHYGVPIQLAGASLGGHPITVSFDHRDTIDDVVEVLARTLDLHVDRTEEAIILSRASSA